MRFTKHKILWIAAILYAVSKGNALYGFTIKAGVSGQLRDVMRPVLEAVRAVWDLNGLGSPVITSIEDGSHMANSKHYQGLAFDVRLNDINVDHELLKQQILAYAGTASYDVVHEHHGTARNHLHIEYDPV